MATQTPEEWGREQARSAMLETKLIDALREAYTLIGEALIGNTLLDPEAFAEWHTATGKLLDIEQTADRLHEMDVWTR